MKKDALFCVGQKAFIEKDGKVLVLNDPQSGVDFPGGKIQEGEAVSGDSISLLNALRREVREETSLEIEIGEPFAVWYYEFPSDHRNAGKVVYLIAFKARYVSGEVMLSDEHSSFDWVDRNTYEKFDDGSEYYLVLKKYFKYTDAGRK